MNQKWWVLSAVACGTFMATLDSSIVNIALPTLTKELGQDLYQIKWVVIIYLLMITCLLLPMGRISDLKGRKNVFQLGFLIFIGGSALCGTAPYLSWLVVFRAIQAIGASMLMANGPAIITGSFSSRERGAALGTLAMVVSAGLVTGPSIGGFLITHLGWRSIFLINIPIGLLGVALAHRFIRKDLLAKFTVSFDWAGTLIQTILLLMFMILFDPPQVSISGSFPFSISRVFIFSMVVLLSFLFVRVELAAQAPLFDLSLLKNRTFWTANLAGFLTFVAFSSVSVLMPFFLEEVLHYPPQTAGFIMTAIPVTIFVIAPLSGRLSDRVGGQELSFAGALIGVIGLFAMGGAFGKGIHENMNPLWIILELCAIGLAIGLFQSPNNSAIMGTVPATKLGTASALLATVRNLGLVTGTGLATGLFTWSYSRSGSFVTALHTSFLTAGLVCAGAMIASLGKKRGPERDQN
jgi:EmrB/QacA subfamily drug resistance transporter